MVPFHSGGRSTKSIQHNRGRDRTEIAAPNQPTDTSKSNQGDLNGEDPNTGEDIEQMSTAPCDEDPYCMSGNQPSSKRPRMETSKNRPAKRHLHHVSDPTRNKALSPAQNQRTMLKEVTL